MRVDLDGETDGFLDRLLGLARKTENEGAVRDDAKLAAVFGETPGHVDAPVESFDCCFGGIGINGHLAFNEPPEPGEQISADAFAALPTRVLTLSRETRTINSVTVGGEIDKRLARAKQQLEQEDEFDYVVVNDDVSRAADELLGIVQRELETAGSMSAP